MSLLNSLLYWSDIPGLYWWVVCSILLLLICGCFLGNDALPNFQYSSRNPLFSLPNLIWALGLFTFLILSRWPRLFYPQSYLIDEDQFLVASWTLARDPLFFRSVETASSGPLNIYPLLLAYLWSPQPDLFSARLVGLILIGVTVGVFYFSLLQNMLLPVRKQNALFD